MAPSRRRIGSRSPSCASAMIRLATAVVVGSFRSTSRSARSVSSNAVTIILISSGPKGWGFPDCHLRSSTMGMTSFVKRTKGSLAAYSDDSVVAASGLVLNDCGCGSTMMAHAANGAGRLVLMVIHSLHRRNTIADDCASATIVDRRAHAYSA